MNSASGADDASGGSAELYRALAAHEPNAPKLGGGLISLVEPAVGYEAEYNRYYENDHFYAGAMAGPWVIAGRRWVATQQLREMRFPAVGGILDSVGDGCYLALYLHLAGHLDDVHRWARAMMDLQLYPHDRGFLNRTNVYTSYCRHEFSVKRNADSPLRDIHALDHPFEGVILEVLEPPPAVERGRWMAHLADTQLPARLAAGFSPMVLAFTARTVEASVAVPNVRAVPGAGTNLNLLWFLDTDPRDVWTTYCGGAWFTEAGTLRLAAPFIPTVPGTDSYVAELR